MKSGPSNSSALLLMLGLISQSGLARPHRVGKDTTKLRSNWTRPHQGAKECARRRAQMQAGRIPREQMLAEQPLRSAA